MWQVGLNVGDVTQSTPDVIENNCGVLFSCLQCVLFLHWDGHAAS